MVGVPIRMESESTPSAERTFLPSNSGLSQAYLATVVIGAIPVLLSHKAWYIAVIVMFTYLWVGWRRAIRGGDVLEFSDSFYYLGFILTLASLLGSLQPFQWVSGQTPDPAAVLQHFGLGMITSLIGVVGRTWLQMYYRAPDETLESTNQQIVAAAHQFLAEVEQLNREASKVLHGTMQSLDQGIQQRVGRVNAALDGMAGHFEAIQRHLSHVDQEQLQKSYAGLSQTITLIDRDLQRVRNETQRASGDLAQKAGETADSLGTARTRMERAAEGTEEAFGRVWDALSRFTEWVNGVEIDQQPVDQAVDRLAHRIDQLEVNTGLIDQAIEGLAGGIGAQGDVLQQTLGTLRSQVEAFTGTIRKLRQDLGEAGVQDLRDALTDLATSVRGTVSLLDGEGQQIGQNTLPRLRASLNDFSGEVLRLQEVLDDVIEAAENQIRQIR